MDSSERFAQIWHSLNRNQKRYIAIVGEFSTKAEAAEAIGISASTVYHWPKVVEEAVRLLQLDLLAGAREELRAAVSRAALVKTGALDEEDARLRQAAASEILDRVLGKATPRPDAGGEGVSEVVVRYENDDQLQGK